MSYENVPQHWCDRVAHARKSRGWSVRMLARKARVSERSITRIESAADGRQSQDPIWNSILGALDLKMEWEADRARFGRSGEKGEFGVYVASPMDSLGDGYPNMRTTTLAALAEIREGLGQTVFYAGEAREGQGNFEEHSWALRDNCRIIDRTKRMVLIYPPPISPHSKPLASSILIEVGYALARKVPVMIFYAKSQDSLPYVLRSVTNYLPQCRLYMYRNSEDIVAAIRDQAEWFK